MLLLALRLLLELLLNFDWLSVHSKGQSSFVEGTGLAGDAHKQTGVGYCPTLGLVRRDPAGLCSTLQHSRVHEETLGKCWGWNRGKNRTWGVEKQRQVVKD